MSEHRQRYRRLESLIHKEVPLSKTIGVAVHEYDGDVLELRADLAPNINVHGVAFGGSIYSVCALAGWGLLVLRLEAKGLDPRIMIAGAEIRYLRPVGQTICAAGAFSSAKDFDWFLDAFNETGKTRIKIPVSVSLDNGEVAAKFVGDYIALERQA